MHTCFMYTIFTKYTNWPLVTFNDLWWCLPEFFNIWDEIWYIGKFYMYKFNQMHKLTFGDPWWPLVAFTLFFDQLRWNLLYPFILCIQCLLNTPIDLWWPFVTFGDAFLSFLLFGMKFGISVHVMYSNLTNCINWPLVTLDDLWFLSPYSLIYWDKICYAHMFYVYNFF